MAIEYLGSKARLLDFVVPPIAETSGVDTVADLFCGTASVSQALSERGKQLIANDHLRLCATLAEAALLAPSEPAFERLADLVPPASGESPYAAVLRHLNELDPDDGFFFRTYSPASAAFGVARMYLTELNAARVDAIRAQITAWDQHLSRPERAVLLRDLVSAVVRVSNTAGTYGCYLKTWKQRALNPIKLEPEAPPLELFPAKQRNHRVLCEDVNDAAAQISGQVDAVYLDPPYTKRQYAAYYHLLETLVTGDEPSVEGSTGLPRWQDRQSDFCYSRRAPAALERLVSSLEIDHLFLSYSNDGHIKHEDIVDILSTKGRTRWWEKDSQRFRSSALEHRSAKVQERLYHVEVG